MCAWFLSAPPYMPCNYKKSGARTYEIKRLPLTFTTRALLSGTLDACSNILYLRLVRCIHFVCIQCKEIKFHNTLSPFSSKNERVLRRSLIWYLHGWLTLHYPPYRRKEYSYVQHRPVQHLAQSKQRQVWLIAMAMFDTRQLQWPRWIISRDTAQCI